MPKETIHAISAGTPEFDVKVGWGPNMSEYVQVGVDNSDGKSLVWQLFGLQRDPMASADTGPLVAVGQAVGEMIAKFNADNEGLDPNDYYLGRCVLNALDLIENPSGVYTGLDRRGLNTLIKTLRRARDAAFGVDA